MSAAVIPAQESNQGAPSEAELDAILTGLRAKAQWWASLPAADVLPLLEKLIVAGEAVAERWVDESVDAKLIDPDSTTVAEEWFGGPFCLVRNLSLLRRTLSDFAAGKKLRLPGGSWTRGDGQAVAGVFPVSAADKLFFKGFAAEVWLEPGIAESEITGSYASRWREPDEGGVALVLAAGNVNSIGPTDTLYKLFVERRVVIVKANPVNDYMVGITREAFAPLIELGIVAVVPGGVEVGDYLCTHDEIDEIHLTGSDRTHDAIVWGTGEAGVEAKKSGRRRIDKMVTSELGNVSPVIVVPGPWSEKEIDEQGLNIASMLANNAGFNCNAARVIVQHEGWRHRWQLLDAIRVTFARMDTRAAFYPGAAERHRAFLEAHPDAEQLGKVGDGHLPWTLIPKLDPDDENEICFQTEAFCSVVSEVGLRAEDSIDYLERAVDFVNDKVWGTLAAMIIVHPKTLADPEVAAAFDSAIARLRYGTVAVNCWAGIGFGMMSTSWGAYPGHTETDIRSGVGVVHNAFMLEGIQKSVVRAPFRIWPRPPWYAGTKRADSLAAKITRFEAKGNLSGLPGIFADAIRG